MTELFTPNMPSPETVIPYGEIQSAKGWEKNPSPVLKEANEALQRQYKKSHLILDLNQPPYNRPGIFLTPEFASCQVVRIGQRRGEEDWLTRGGSAHNVTFGVAEMRNTEGRIKSLNVAVKQFSKSESGLAEAVNNYTVLSRGFKTTLPIAIISDNGSGGYVMTLARKDTKSLDTEPWHQYQSGNSRTRFYFEQLLYRASVILSSYNCSGIRHGDAQMKNFWVTPRGNVEAIDWEASTIYPNPLLIENFLTSSIDDLSTLFKSLSGEYEDFPTEVLVGTREKKWIQFNDLVLKNYNAQVLSLFAENPPIIDITSRQTLSDDAIERLCDSNYDTQDPESITAQIRNNLRI